jgi:hypothetical protein
MLAWEQLKENGMDKKLLSAIKDALKQKVSSSYFHGQ